MSSLLSLSLLFLFILITPPSTTAQPPGPPPPSFNCSSKSTCTSLVGYISPNTTTLSHIQSLFQVKTLSSLLGANNFPDTTPPNHTVPANSTVKIPFPCRCINGKGLSDKVPMYKIVKDDGLYHIAAQVFSGLVTYPQIQTANQIKDPNLIIIGHELWIPLPCSCDDVEGEKVVHYAHVVGSGSSVEDIADQFGTSPQTLMTLNGITDPKMLQAGQVLDVPLRACSSSVRNTSPDYPLLVPGDTYVETAHNCVRCTCDASKNYVLKCQESSLKPVDWKSCPSTDCTVGNNSAIGLGISIGSSRCNFSTCDYEGYMNNNTIFTTFVDHSTCAAPGPNGSSSNALKMHLGGWSCTVVVLLMLYRFL